MSDLVSIPVSKEIFTRLQRLAVPLVDDPSAVIEKLLNHWEVRNSEKTSTAAATKAEIWRSDRGDALPVGTPLQASYVGKTFRAIVEKNGIRFNGKIFGSLSAAAIIAKGQCGRKGRTASTNGREFWKFQHPESDQWVPVASLRQSHRVEIDTDALLAKLGIVK